MSAEDASGDRDRSDRPAPGAPAAAAVPPVVVPRWVQLVMLPLALLGPSGRWRAPPGRSLLIFLDRRASSR